MVVIPDPLSARTFFDCGVLSSMKTAMGDIVVAFRGDRDDYARWAEQKPGFDYIWEARLDLGADASLIEKAHRYLDDHLDTAIGWYPLAIRLNLKHGFHLERMAPDHKNWYLDSARIGVLPQWEWLYSLMFAWVFNTTRHVSKSVVELVKHRASILILSNLQAPGVYEYIVAARRHGVPVVGYIASWDHTVGKGIVYPGCVRYIVQNKAMKNDLLTYHGIDEEKIVVTGWPQTDVFARRRLRDQYVNLIESYGLDPAKKTIFITGNTKTNAPYEPQFLARFLTWLNKSELDVSVVFRPHPKDRKWKTRFSNINLHQHGFFAQPASYTDMDDLACLLQHVDCVVTHAGTILLDSLVNGRPAVCVVYDEAADGEVRYAEKNVIGKHYEDLMNSGSFLVARSMEEVAAGVEQVLSNPAMFYAQRRRVSKKIVGELDGEAALRVAQAVASCARLE